MNIRPVKPGDNAVWLSMRCTLMPSGSEEIHREQIDHYFSDTFDSEYIAFLAVDENDQPKGFAEVSIRGFAEGCQTDRVAYLEAWFVVPDVRRQGIGQQLISAAEAWGRAKGCPEFASDTEAANNTSSAAHLALGFEDVGTFRCFRKEL